MIDTLLFGLPRTMPEPDARAATGYLRGLWLDAFGQVPGGLLADLQLCRRFFDPLTRGQSLRTRLAELPVSPPAPFIGAFSLTDPVLVTIDDERRLVGVEARLVIEVLEASWPTDGFIQMDDEAIDHANDLALRTYRLWASQRLDQVIALRRGTGAETLQAKSVGLVLALMINRSTDASRAVRPDDDLPTAEGVEKALFDAAEAFAAGIAGRSGRSDRENRMKGGYAVTEARRRLPDLRIGKAAGGPGGTSYWLEPGSERRVLEQIIAELARRPRLTSPELAKSFDALVEAYRTESRRSAWRGGFFERQAETTALRDRLLAGFQATRPALDL